MFITAERNPIARSVREKFLRSREGGKNGSNRTGGIREDRGSVVVDGTVAKSNNSRAPFFSLRQRGIARKKKGEGEEGVGVEMGICGGQERVGRDPGEAQ